jgi:hypothetical protein
LAGVMAGFAVALWLGAVAPLAGAIVSSWGALTILHALAVAVATGLALLVATAGALLAVDWRADILSRQAWAQMNIATAELTLPIGAVSHSDFDPRYLPAVDDEALGRIFQARRCAPRAPVLGSSERVSTSVVATSEDELPGHAIRAVPGTLRAGATIVAAANRKGSCGGRAVARARLVVNGSAWWGWPGAEYTLSPILAQRHTADIVVLGSRQGDQARAPPERSAGSDVSGSTEPPSCRGPPQAGHRACAVEATSAKPAPGRAPAAGKVPATDPMVHDNLAEQVPVCAAELDVIETYLGHVVQDLLASSMGGAGHEQT